MNHQNLPKKPPKFQVGCILQSVPLEGIATGPKLTIVDVYWSIKNYTYKVLDGSKITTIVENVLLNNHYKVVGHSQLAKSLDLTHLSNFTTMTNPCAEISLDDGGTLTILTGINAAIVRVGGSYGSESNQD